MTPVPESQPEEIIAFAEKLDRERIDLLEAALREAVEALQAIAAAQARLRALLSPRSET